MSKNAKLSVLNCFGNQLSSLDVSQNPLLTQLWCDDNQLSSLNLSSNTALAKLFCSGNQLSGLDVSKNTSLTQLWCDDNLISGAAMDALVSSLPTISSGNFIVIDTESSDEHNVCTKSQVDIAKRKGWKVFDNHAGDEVEYVGSDVPTSISTLENPLSNPVFHTIDGRRLQAHPTQKGIYIAGGRKILVK